MAGFNGPGWVQTDDSVQAVLPHMFAGRDGTNVPIPRSYVTGNGVVPPADIRPGIANTAPREFDDFQALQSDKDWNGWDRRPQGIPKQIYNITSNAQPNTFPSLDEQGQIYYIEVPAGGY